MASPQRAKVLDEVLDFLLSGPTLEQIIDYHGSEDFQKYARTLLERNRDNTLTEDEQIDIEEISQINHVFTLLKGRALILMNEREAVPEQ